MTHQQKVSCSTACKSYDLKGVDLGSKTMREIMDAATMGEDWATKIIQTDQTNISQSYTLNPQNTRSNLYGALSLGIQAKANFNSSDATVTKKLGEWLTNLNKQFPGLKSYTPDSLAQLASDLAATAKCIGGHTKTLASTGELTTQDANYLNSLVKGLGEFAQAAKTLHTAVCAGPDITSVALNIAAKKH